ncbi:hypothetical protein ACH5RR_010362 [Cinchona calisaya]|uniref:IBH1-like N-terminal domain-containing protein n=1 Tax=Cinchona calisaya TaxID=153742 RepID=A0ABD3AIQ0_9GENT
MNPQNIHPNPRSTRTRFAYRFLRAMKKLNKQRTPPTSIRETYKRYHMVKVAAYESMALAVGSKRAWSRALLWKIKNRGLKCSFLKRSKTRVLRERNTNILKENPSRKGTFGFQEEANELRKLVPGGEGMDLLTLYDETGHYIKCLTSQISSIHLLLRYTEFSISLLIEGKEEAAFSSL